MAAYAPSSSLLYLESNNPPAILETITGTRAWRTLAREMGASPERVRVDLTQRFIRWTGIGSTESVVLLRSQVAVIVTGFVTSEEGDTLRVKPEGVLIVETHTSAFRIRGFVKRTLQKLAEQTFVNPAFSQINREGTEFMEWTSNDGKRQLVAVVHGSVVFVGNARSAVEACLATYTSGNSLKTDPSLHQMRSQMRADNALAFGYVSAQNSPRLLSAGLPLLIGRAPDADLQRAIETSATKLFGALAWSCKPYSDGIEDHYLVSLQPDVGRQLASSLGKVSSYPLRANVPSDAVSVTHYRFEDSLGAWRGLRTAVSSRTDALSAVLFSSILKTALVSYGVNDPEELLRLTEGEVVTIRLDETGERSLLLASIRDAAAFQIFATCKLGLKSDQNLPNYYLLSRVEGNMALSLIDKRLVIGTAADVRRYIESEEPTRPELSQRMNIYFAPTTYAQVITQTDDSARLRAFVEAIRTMKKKDGALPPEAEQKISALPFATIETAVKDSEIDRVTRSSLGQFSFISSLLLPDRTQSAPVLPSSR